MALNAQLLFHGTLAYEQLLVAIGRVGPVATQAGHRTAEGILSGDRMAGMVGMSPLFVLGQPDSGDILQGCGFHLYFFPEQLQGHIASLTDSDGARDSLTVALEAKIVDLDPQQPVAFRCVGLVTYNAALLEDRAVQVLFASLRLSQCCVAVQTDSNWLLPD